MAPVEVTLDNFEDLLAYDDVLLDYFNAFLSLPVFSQQLHYNRLTGTFEDLQETDAISRNSPLSDGPPRTPPAYGATDVERQRAMQWAASHRLPIFFKTQLFREYKLCRLLLKRLDSTRSKHAPQGSAGGYSRRTTSSCTSTTANSADNSAKDADLDDSYAACWSDGSAMFNKSYDGPGTRATSLPVYAGLCFSPTKIDENVRSDMSKPIDSPRRPVPSSARNIAGLNTEHDDFGFQTEHVVMETSQTNLASVADVEIPKLQLVSNSDSLDTDQTGRQMARDTFSSSCCNMADDEAAIESRTEPEDPTINDLGLTDEGIQSLEGRLKMSLQEMTQAVIGSMECMDQFRQFLQPTSGRHLFNFWLDCEYYQDVVQDFDDENGATQRNRLFREIQDKYKLTLNAETLQQFMEAANHFGLSRSVFIQTQYNTLRRLRAYWIPRYILHKERLGELEPALHRQQLLLADDVLDGKRRDSITSGLFPSLSVVKSLPVNPHRNQISRASSISSGNQTNIEIKSMPSGQGSERKSSEADSQRKNLRDRFIAALSVEKKAGQPFRHFLQKSGEFDLLCNLLFWEDVFDYSLTESRSADRLLRFTRAWDIYNRYLSPGALWNIGAPQDLTDKIYSKLTIHKDASKLQIFTEATNLAVDKLQDAWIGFLKHDLKEYLECQVDQSGEDFQLIDISNIHLSFDSSGQKLVRYFPPTPRDPGDASNGRTKQATDREGILERKRLMERERRKAIRAARIRQKEAKIRLKNALLQEQDMIASGLKADEDRLSALDAAEAVEKPTLDKSLNNKSIMNAYRKYLSEGNNPDLCNALALFFEVDTYFSLGAAALNKSKKDTLATLLNRLYLQPDSRKRVQLNNYLATQLQNEKDRKRPRSPVLKEIETFLRPVIEANFDKYVEQQMAKSAQMKSLQTQNSTLKTKTSTNRAEEFDAAASIEAVFGNLFSTTTQFDSTSQLALHGGPSKSLRRRATMAAQGTLLPPVEEADDTAGPLFSMPSKLRRQFQSISDTRSLPPISISMFEPFELSPKKDFRFTGYVDRLRSSYLNRSQNGGGTTDATSVQGSKQTVKGPSKLPPLRDDRAQFLAALTQASAGHLPLHMWLYYEYLVQCGEEEGNNRLDRDLFFYCEVFKFKEASHLFADEELLKRKVQSILDIYLEPATTKETAKEKDANTPLDITSEVHQKTIKAAQKYAAGRDVSSTIFDDAQASVFKELLPYWVGFMANYTPPRDGRPIPMTRQMRARRKKLEEVMSWKPPSAKSVSLPVRPEGANVVSSFTFTIHDGFQWKENRTTDDSNSHAADKLSDLDESDELRRLRKTSLASHSTGGATGSDSRIPRHGIPQVAPLAAI